MNLAMALPIKANESLDCPDIIHSTAPIHGKNAYIPGNGTFGE